MVEQMRSRPIRRDDRTAVRRSRAAGDDLLADRHADLRRLDGITGIFNAHLMLALAIERFGTEAQKRHWLPKFATGEIRGGLALTEPDAGTDLQGIRMTAPEGDYVINGTKTWITNGIEGSCFAVLVKTDPEARPRHKGMSLFIAPKRPGVTRRQQAGEAGYKAIDSASSVRDYACPPIT